MAEPELVRPGGAGRGAGGFEDGSPPSARREQNCARWLRGERDAG